MSPLRLAVVLFPTCLQLGLQAKATEVLPCIPLTGITPGGGDGVLDEDLLRVTLEKEPWDLSNPLVGIVATCAGELETPVSMRNLLGKTRARVENARLHTRQRSNMLACHRRGTSRFPLTALFCVIPRLVSFFQYNVEMIQNEDRLPRVRPLIPASMFPHL